jgi:hypothetical protein
MLHICHHLLLTDLPVCHHHQLVVADWEVKLVGVNLTEYPSMYVTIPVETKVAAAIAKAVLPTVLPVTIIT